MILEWLFVLISTIITICTGQSTPVVVMLLLFLGISAWHDLKERELLLRHVLMMMLLCVVSRVRQGPPWQSEMMFSLMLLAIFSVMRLLLGTPGWGDALLLPALCFTNTIGNSVRMMFFAFVFAAIIGMIEKLGLMKRSKRAHKMGLMHGMAQTKRMETQKRRERRIVPAEQEKGFIVPLVPGIFLSYLIIFISR